MNGKHDAFGNDIYRVRVPYDASIAKLDDSDAAILRSAVAEFGGFAGNEISDFMAELGFTEEELKAAVESLQDPGRSDPVPERTLRGLFVLCSLVSAVLGDEELATITGRGRDEHFLTIRRLYHAWEDDRRQSRHGSAK